MRGGMIGRAVLVVTQVAVFWAIAELGRAIVSRLGIPLPGNLVGMVILLALLGSGIVRPEWVEPAATLLLRHLAFFFVPIAVGLMAMGDLLRAQGVPLLAVLLVSAGVGIVASGATTQAIARRRPDEPPGTPGVPGTSGHPDPAVAPDPADPVGAPGPAGAADPLAQPEAVR